MPVFADFVFEAGTDPDDDDPVTAASLRIVALLPNPSGTDAGHEEVTIGNFGTAEASLAGWKLRDRANNEFTLSGSLPPSSRLTIIMTSNTMPLNNSGDDITLIDNSDNVLVSVSYAGGQASSGAVVRFD